MTRSFTAFHVRTWALHDHVVVRVEDVRAGISTELTGVGAVEIVRVLRSAFGPAEERRPDRRGDADGVGRGDAG